MTSPSSIRLLCPYPKSYTVLYRFSFEQASEKWGKTLKFSRSNLKIFKRFQFNSWGYSRFESSFGGSSFSLHFLLQAGEELDQVAMAFLGYLAGGGGEECVLEPGELESELVNRSMIAGL